MELSAPIYQLKRRAKTLARTQRIPLHEALDQVAKQEGFKRWSLLTVRALSADKSAHGLAQPGTLSIIGARPRQGKTLFCLELLVKGIQRGNDGYFFSLEFSHADILRAFAALDVEPTSLDGKFHFDNGDAISADYIADSLTQVATGSVVVIDYLQVLDQDRNKPALNEQLRVLRQLADEKQLVVLAISQIHQSFNATRGEIPSLADVRLPNPIDLSVFDQACFMHDGEVALQAIA